MTHIEYLKEAINKQVRYAKDADLLDFILKLLISESRDNGLHADVVTSR